MLDFPSGDHAYVHRTATIGQLSIGRWSYVNARTILSGRYPIVVGAFTSIAMNVYCWTCESHQTDYVSTYPLRTVLGMDIGYPELVEKPQGVRIGNDVWICEGVRLLPGTVIEDGCVIATRALAAGHYPAYGIYGGVPAKLIRRRYPETVVAQLQRLCWWEWPLEKILRNSRFFSLNLAAFHGTLQEHIRD